MARRVWNGWGESSAGLRLQGTRGAVLRLLCAASGRMAAVYRADTTEGGLMPHMHPNLPPPTWRENVVTGLVIVLGFLLAWGLALLTLGG